MTTETAEVVLECDDLHRFLGEAENRVHVLDSVSLELHAGYVYSIMGPSGCGKSTLLYLLGLLDRPDTGTIHIAGHEVSSFDDHALSVFRNQEIGFVFQFHFLLKEFTASENVQIPMRRAGVMSRAEMSERADHLLDLVGLGDKVDRPAHHLSGGEQQRPRARQRPAAPARRRADRQPRHRQLAAHLRGAADRRARDRPGPSHRHAQHAGRLRLRLHLHDAGWPDGRLGPEITPNLRRIFVASARALSTLAEMPAPSLERGCRRPVP